jgi:hypothetical protein
MRSYFGLIIALVLGIVIGIAIGGLRIYSTPWEGLPAVDAQPESRDANPAGGPQAVIDCLEYNFGTLDLEKSGRHEFTVTNRGNALLKLTKGETTCRCTASDLERTELSPGESTKITLNWRPTSEPGPYQQSATFYTNEANKPRFTITINGKITATIRVKPTTLTMSRISAHEITQGTVTILSYLDEPLEVSNPRFEENGTRQYFDLTTTPLSEQELKPSVGAKSGILLTVIVKPGLPQGAFKQTITLTTNNPDRKQVTIPVEGSVGNEISLVGPGWDSEHNVLYLGLAKSQEGLSRRLLLVVHGPYRREVHFKLTEPPPVPLKITLGSMTEINNGQVAQTPLLIEIPKGSPQVSHLGHTEEGGGDIPDDAAKIQIETTHPEIPKLSIPVRFAVEK